MDRGTPSLLELQRAFGASLTGDLPSADVLQAVTGAIGAAARLAVYRDTSVSALTAALRLNYPAVCKLVGDEFFEGAARAFIAEHRADTPWLDQYGRGFGAFLAQFPPASALRYLPDVAELEWAVSGALHAPEATAIALAELAALPPAASECLRLRPHPALNLLRADAPTDAIWQAVLEGDDAALGAIDLNDRPVHLLIERRDCRVCVQRLKPAAWRFTEALCAGTPLGAAVRDHPDCAADQLLADHLAAGRFCSFEVCEGAGLGNLPEWRKR